MSSFTQNSTFKHNDLSRVYDLAVPSQSSLLGISVPVITSYLVIFHDIKNTPTLSAMPTMH